MFENDNFSGSTNDSTTTPEGGNEYRFVRDEIPHRSYMDASFSSSGEGCSAPRSYYTPPEALNKKKRRQEIRAEKKAKRAETRASGSGGGASRWVTLVCACLICALLGGIGGGAIVSSAMPDSTPVPQVSGGGIGLTISPSTEPVTPITPVLSGNELSGTDIYTLGSAQAVGIATEITYTNAFGIQTNSAVSGSGFIVTSDGYVVTNYHVIESALIAGYGISVFTYDGTKYPATIVGAEEQNDVAVLKVDAKGLSPVTIGNSDNMQVGETIYAIGNPLGELTFTMSTGSVSALDRNITTANRQTGAKVTNNMFQIDAAVNSGNSGGPVYNSRGEVIGIVTAKYASSGIEGLGFAIPINDALDIINDLIDIGYVSGKPSFGIVATTVDSAVAQYYDMVEGAFVYSVNPGSCSETAGIKKGDIITAIDDTAITSKNDLIFQKKNYKAGDSVTLKVYRDGEYLDIPLVFDEEQPETSAENGSDSGTGTPDSTQGSIQGAPKQ